MTKFTRYTLTVLLAAAPLALFAQPTGGKLSGGKPTVPATAAATPAPPKVGDDVQDTMKGRPTPAPPANPGHDANIPVEKTARVIEYHTKDKTEMKRVFVFHKDADGKLLLKEYDKLDGKEISSNPDSLEWALHTIGVTDKGAEGDTEVIGPDKKTYHVKKDWHSLNSADVKKVAAGAHGEKLLDTDLYVNGTNGWAKPGAKPKTTSAAKSTAKPKTAAATTAAPKATK